MAYLSGVSGRAAPGYRQRSSGAAGDASQPRGAGPRVNITIAGARLNDGDATNSVPTDDWP